MAITLKKNFWKDKKIFLSGHTSFKGSWLIKVLEKAEALVLGYSNSLPSKDCLYLDCELHKKYPFFTSDNIQDYGNLNSKIENFHPDIAIHFAAQPLVRKSYEKPLETFKDNINGTANFVLACLENRVKTILIITTDKVYRNDELGVAFKEDSALGGYDPYSASKAAAEIVTESLSHSFPNEISKVFTARAGNVIGGGDWGEDRLIPDIFRAIMHEETLSIRNPKSIRPWQHVLEPISGYLKLIEKSSLINESFDCFNFGPGKNMFFTVEDVLKEIKKYAPQISFQFEPSSLYESKILKLDSAKAKDKLNWESWLSFSEVIGLTCDWYLSRESEKSHIVEKQIDKLIEIS